MFNLSLSDAYTSRLIGEDSRVEEVMIKLLNDFLLDSIIIFTSTALMNNANVKIKVK